MKHTLTCATLLALMLVSMPQATAQDDDMPDMEAMEAMMDAAPSTYMSFWQCDWASLPEIVQSVNTYMKPAAEEMIDEGLLINWGLMVHSYGDEWNVVFHSSAGDVAALIEANAELNNRATANAEAAGRDTSQPNPIIRNCSSHKDNFYTNAAYLTN